MRRALAARRSSASLPLLCRSTVSSPPPIDLQRIQCPNRDPPEQHHETRPDILARNYSHRSGNASCYPHSELKFAKTRHCTPRLFRTGKLTCHRQTRSAQSDAQSAFRATLAPRPSCASMGHRRCTCCTLAASMEQTAAAMNEYVRTFHPIHEAIPSEMRSARWHQVELDHEGYSPLSRTSAAGAASTLW